MRGSGGQTHQAGATWAPGLDPVMAANNRSQHGWNALPHDSADPPAWPKLALRQTPPAAGGVLAAAATAWQRSSKNPGPRNDETHLDTSTRPCAGIRTRPCLPIPEEALAGLRRRHGASRPGPGEPFCQALRKP